jgi:hypothetical protein
MLHKAKLPIGVLATVLATGCPRPVLPPPEVRHEPTIVGPKKPIEAVFGRVDDNGRWLRLRDITFAAGKTFGWRIRLPCRQPVEYTEVMKLPSPGDWTFDPAELRETTISGDGKIATTHDYATCLDGWIEHSWSIAKNDPLGDWEISVTIPDYEPQVWRVRFVK